MTAANGIARGLALVPVLVGLSATPPCAARTEARSPYTKTQTFSAALRYLRVDLEYEITEQDPDAAYLLFQYVEPGRKASRNGAIEIVEAPGTIKVLVQLANVPSYYETHLRDGLLRKMEEDYGPAPERPPQKRAAPKPEESGRDEPGADDQDKKSGNQNDAKNGKDSGDRAPTPPPQASR